MARRRTSGFTNHDRPESDDSDAASKDPAIIWEDSRGLGRPGDPLNSTEDSRTEPVLAPVTKRQSPRLLVSGGALVAVLLIWLVSAGGDEVSVEPDTSPTTELRPDSEASERVTPTTRPRIEIDPLAPWPLPPVDHNPHVIGRPGTQPLAVAEGLHQSIVYVNLRGRPTVIDLATGNQQEVVVATVRSIDTFAVEFGEVVATEPKRRNLTRSRGRPIIFAVDQTGRQPNDFPAAADPGLNPSEQNKTANGSDNAGVDETDSSDQFAPQPMGPLLCASEQGCGEARWLEGTFGNAIDRASSLPAGENPLAIIARIIGASSWQEEDGPFTFYTVRRDGSDHIVRVPTPQKDAILWVVEHDQGSNSAPS